METKGQIGLCVGDTSLHEFMVVGNLPMNCDILLGQDWLERFGYRFQIPNLGINLPAYSETLMRIPTTEKGSRLVEAQELQGNAFCASSVVECVDSSFICLIINCNSTDEILKKFQQTQGFSKLSGRFYDAKKRELQARNQALQAQLRLAHTKKGEHKIRQICAEFTDVFKLPGDKLTSSSAIKHYIPTPTITANRSIILRNYTIPERHQKEVDIQIQQMVEDKIIQPSQSPWNFSILIVPK
jgi:hypothetical protein